jgi:hypothetical protein
MLKYFRSAIRHTSVKEPQSFSELGLQHIEALDTTNNLARPVVWPMLTIFMAAEGERFKELIGPLGLEVRDRLLETVRDAWYLRLERQGDAQQI